MIYMTKKIVGITCDIKGKFFESEIIYSQKVINAGGVPFYLPMDTTKKNVSKIAACLDCLIVTGSRDIDPSFYGEKKSSSINELDKNRTLSELIYINIMKKKNKKILGICGGMQLINVAFSGSLYQDIELNIPSSINHNRNSDSKKGVRHTIRIATDSTLHRLFGKSIATVNSYHHQAIKLLGNSLIVAAKSEDGIIEAYEDKSGRVLGVQWHPELSKAKSDFEIFKWLIEQ